MEEIKLYTTVNLIFYVPDFLRLFMMSYKYGQTLLRYSSTNSFHHHYFLSQYNCYSKNYFLLLVYNNFYYYESALIPLDV